jgi:asparagine synthase (glutamine-hydrolysing)
MCGLVFAIATHPVHDFINVAHQRQQHRGPDDEGMHFEEMGDVHLGMAHERLAIIDLTENAAQPMLSASGRFRILLNGEIYNYRELATQFGLTDLRSGSDTEVAVELIERLGIDEACRLFNGMWAMVLQDRTENRILVSRDRFGKKPIYVRHDATGIYMASEMHSLLGLPGVALTPDLVVAARFLAQSLQNVDDRSWIQGISSFPPASIGEIDVSNPAAGIVRARRFWEPVLDGPGPQRPDGEAIEELRALVQDATRLRLHADVPVGVALSGGLDSSIISVQAAQYARAQGQETMLFSAVNPGSNEDESEHINTMARHLGVDVQCFSLDPTEGDGLFGLLQRCMRHADGPISSFSNILFYKLMESARSAGITVVMTGQGADEAFCGYRKYPFLEIKRRLKTGHFGGAVALGAGFVLNGTLLPEFNLREAKRYAGASNRSLLGEATAEALQLEPLSRITTLAERQWEDVSRYSVPYLCHYEDRMSMAWSREVRSPFLDYRVVELGLQFPERLKLARGWTKYSLRRAFENDLPASITWRKDKKGFINPQDDWLKGILQPIIREMMFETDARVYQHGLVDREAYIDRFDAYCAGRGNVWFRDVFAPFSLELWLCAISDIAQEMAR